MSDMMRVLKDEILEQLGALEVFVSGVDSGAGVRRVCGACPFTPSGGWAGVRRVSGRRGGALACLLSTQSSHHGLALGSYVIEAIS